MFVKKVSLTDHKGYVNDVSFSPDGKFATAGQDGLINIYHMGTLEKAHCIDNGSIPVNAVDFSNDCKYLVAGYEDSSVKQFDLSTFELINVLQKHDYKINLVKYSQSSKKILTASNDFKIIIWDGYKPLGVLYNEIGHKSQIVSAVFSQNEELVYSTGMLDQQLNIWELTTFTQVKSINLEENGCIVSLNPTANQMITGGQNKQLRVWDTESYEQGEVFPEDENSHTDWISSLNFSKDGLFIVTGSVDKSFKIWDVQTKTCVQTFTEHTDGISKVVFSDDGSSLLSASQDCSSILWAKNSE